MSKTEEINYEGIERLPLKTFAEKAYLDYSMYVILDRALPHVGDGLKPVQRRIVYAMSELGLSAVAKHKKSARTVGDVLGKFHPHGDSACYEAMVLMAQPFSYRYTLVDGQGNWGSPDDPKSFAAMRYTEARLTRYSELLLSELGQGTVDWQPNFDGTLDEPALLPARLPNVLLNGSTGIAVGMATDIPPHNAREIAKACIHLLQNPDASMADLCQFVLGPDFPTDAEIVSPRDELMQMYQTGNGSVRLRARYIIEDGCVVITALPYQVSGAKILEQIAQQMNAKKLPMVEDLRDESDHESPTRLVIVPRSNRVELDAMMAHLFATTELERTYRVNMNVVGLDGRPQVKNLKTMLSEWLTYRERTVVRRLQWRLDKVERRLHILEGLLIAYLNIDEVIKIIRKHDEPKPVLMKRFELTDTQAEAILELKLRHLAKLEEMAIRGEQKELEKERKHLKSLLGSRSKLITLIGDEIAEDAQKYGDERRSPIVQRAAAKALDETELLPNEAITVVLSSKGWVRAAKGHELDPVSLNYKAGDEFMAAARGRSNQSVVFLDSDGRSYSTASHTLPSARSQGEPLTGRFTPASGVAFVGVVMGEADDRIVLAADNGYGFVARLEDLYAKNKAGKAVLSVSSGSKALPMARVNQLSNDVLVSISNVGYMLAFPVNELPELAKGKGNKIIGLAPGKNPELLAHIAVVPVGKSLKLFSGARAFTLKTADLKEFMGARGRRGGLLPRGLQKVDRVEVIDA